MRVSQRILDTHLTRLEYGIENEGQSFIDCRSANHLPVATINVVNFIDLFIASHVTSKPLRTIILDHIKNSPRFFVQDNAFTLN